MSTIIAELERFGPGRHPEPPPLRDAERYCRSLAMGHYENFPIASVLLPRRTRQHLFNIYAYCRWADDLGDEAGSPDRACELLAWWRSELEACYAGRVTHPVFVALQPTISRFDLPITLFADLLSAFEQDQRVTRYEDFARLVDYCRRSANPVGRLVLAVFEQASDENIRDSDSVCTGLQLANFWQDVSRDLDLGRIYLPLEDLHRFGYGQEQLQLRETNEAFQEMMRFEVARAREFLLAGRPLAERLSGRLGLSIELFAGGGLRILERIETMGYRVLERRPVVTKFDMLRLAAASLGRTICRPLTHRREDSL